MPVEEQAAGFILVRPASGAGGVDLVFDEGVRAVGMTIQNGTTHADTTRGFPRRPFRFIPMDRYGAPIEEYRWYTNQGPGGAGFYGAASSTPIHRVRVEEAWGRALDESAGRVASERGANRIAAASSSSRKPNMSGLEFRRP